MQCAVDLYPSASTVRTDQHHVEIAALSEAVPAYLLPNDLGGKAPSAAEDMKIDLGECLRPAIDVVSRGSQQGASPNAAGLRQREQQPRRGSQPLLDARAENVAGRTIC